MSEGDLLFWGQDLRAFLQEREQEMYREIDGWHPTRLLNTNLDELCRYFEDRYAVAPLRLLEDQITTDKGEAAVDVSQDRGRAIFDRSQPFYITGTEVTFFVPFDGEPMLFQCKPSQFTFNPPCAVVADAELAFRYTRTDHDAEAIKNEFSRDLGETRRYVGWSGQQVQEFNADLGKKAKRRIEARREKLLKDEKLVADLGFPLRRREDAPRTYTVPEIQRKPQIRKPAPAKAARVPEPAMDMEDYEHILSVINNMVDVMERSPRAFQDMGEEDLRQHFLVQLNGQYRGQATGETFNFEGKTDILVRVEGRSVFIAECKFWNGPKSVTGAVDQLLGYASWHDTKTALLVFNRGGRFSSVCAKIPEAVKAHPNFVRILPYESDTGWRFVLHHRDDEERELILTVLAFEVPA